jgi:hypothetical protein
METIVKQTWLLSLNKHGSCNVLQQKFQNLFAYISVVVGWLVFNDYNWLHKWWTLFALGEDKRMSEHVSLVELSLAEVSQCHTNSPSEAPEVLTAATALLITPVRGFEPGRSRRIFGGEKNPQRTFLRRGSKAVWSNLADLRHVKEPCDLGGSRNRRPFLG